MAESIPGVALPFMTPVARWSYDLQFAVDSFDEFLAAEREYGRDVVFGDDHWNVASSAIAREGNGTLSFAADDNALRFLAEMPEDEAKWTTAQRDAWMAYEQKLMLSVSVGSLIFDYEVKSADDGDDGALGRDLLTVTRAGMVELSRVPRPAFVEAVMDFSDGAAGKPTPCRVWLASENESGELVEFSYEPAPKPKLPTGPTVADLLARPRYIGVRHTH